MPVGLVEGRLHHLVPPADLAGLAMWDTSGRCNGLQGCRDGRLGEYHIQPLGDVVGLFGVRTEWGCDRMALYYSQLRFVSRNSDATLLPPPLEIQIRAGADGCQNVITTVEWSPTEYGGSDLLIQVCSRLCTQWEVWARSMPTEAETNVTVGVAFRMLIDRSGGCRDAAPALQFGPNVAIPGG